MGTLLREETSPHRRGGRGFVWAGIHRRRSLTDHVASTDELTAAATVFGPAGNPIVQGGTDRQPGLQSPRRFAQASFHRPSPRT